MTSQIQRNQSSSNWPTFKEVLKAVVLFTAITASPTALQTVTSFSRPTSMLNSNNTAEWTCPINSGMDISLPKNYDVHDVYSSLFPLHRKIESHYRHLPWPDSIQKIAVATEVRGGRGDISAAAKVIASIQGMCPKCVFDWIIDDIHAARAFLNLKDPSKVNIRPWGSPSPDTTSADLLITGPVKNDFAIPAIERAIKREIIGDTAFGFTEIGPCWPANNYSNLKQKVVQGTDLERTYQKLHRFIFPPANLGNGMGGKLQMGIHPGSGIFLDESRVKAPLSRGYCCPSYLLQIQDVSLRKDVLEAMDVFDGQSQPDYDQHSFNSGYAHLTDSWSRFIDSVAIHERDKHIVIVLNHRGEFQRLSTEEFRDRIFTPERLSFLNEKGYGAITLKGEGQEPYLLQPSEYPKEKRRLTVIVRPSFISSDMKQLQLASERILATGDNSAAEAWSSRCKLYLYETIWHKTSFLEQQVNLAKDISPNLAKLLAMFGEENRPFEKEQMSELEQILSDPNLSDATLKFCDRIIQDYSFEPVLEGGIKRTVWHRTIPELAEIEAATLDLEFRTGLASYVKNPNKVTLAVRALPELAWRVKETVQNFLLQISG